MNTIVYYIILKHQNEDFCTSNLTHYTLNMMCIHIY